MLYEIFNIKYTLNIDKIEIINVGIYFLRVIFLEKCLILDFYIYLKGIGHI